MKTCYTRPGLAKVARDRPGWRTDTPNHYCAGGTSTGRDDMRMSKRQVKGKATATVTEIRPSLNQLLQRLREVVHQIDMWNTDLERKKITVDAWWKAVLPLRGELLQLREDVKRTRQGANT